MTDQSNDKTLTIREAAKATGYTPMRLYQRIYDGTLAAMRVPSFEYRIPASAIPELKREKEDWARVMGNRWQSRKLAPVAA